ncbi:glycosyltransferase family 2 protein [Methylomagnum sp.]
MVESPPNTVPKVAVIIVNYNGGDYLIQCINALRQQTFPIQQIILVDNASTLKPIIGHEPWLTGIQLIRLESNLGFAAANNWAVKSAKEADWIALLNPDAFPDPDWLAKLMQATDKFPHYSSFACRMLCAENPEILDGAGDNYYASGRVKRRGHGMPASGRYLSYDEVFSPCAGAALYKKTAFDEAGGFDEDFFCYLEDVDLGFRLRLAGHRCLYVPDAVVLHVGSGITGRHSDFSTYYGHRNLVWGFIKNMPGILFWLYLPLHLAMNMSSLFICAGRGQGLLSLRAKLDALKQLPNMLRKRRLIQPARIDVWAIRNMMKHECFRRDL